MKILSTLLAVALLTSCGYSTRSASSENISSNSNTTISIPYVIGDIDGSLTSAITQAVAETGHFKCVNTGGDLDLLVRVTSQKEDLIGFRFDRLGPGGTLQDRLEPVERRRFITVEVSLVDNASGKILIEKETVKAHEDYDYVDSHSINDLSFLTPTGSRISTLEFSLGQLDSVQGAQDNAAIPLFQKIGEQIAYALMNQ